MTYWINVDFPTSRTRVHRSDCIVGIPQAKDAANGYWQSFPSLSEAEAAKAAEMKDTGLCLLCLDVA